jgi:hypothetical protein
MESFIFYITKEKSKINIALICSFSYFTVLFCQIFENEAKYCLERERERKNDST